MDLNKWFWWDNECSLPSSDDFFNSSIETTSKKIVDIEPHGS
jgi:hypothetical protein